MLALAKKKKKKSVSCCKMLSIKDWNFSPGWQEASPDQKDRSLRPAVSLDRELGQGLWGWRVSRCFSVHTCSSMSPRSTCDAPSMTQLLLVASRTSLLVTAYFPIDSLGHILDFPPQRRGDWGYQSCDLKITLCMYRVLPSQLPSYPLTLWDLL